MYAYSYITQLTVIAELEEIKVCAERLKPETPFMDAAIICTRGFLLLWGVARELGSDNLAEGRQKLEDAIERAKMWFKSLLAGHAPRHKISGSKRFYPDCLKRSIENEYYKNRLCERLSNLNLDKRVKQRDHDLLSSCEVASFSKRLIVREGQISTLICYMQMVR